MGRAREKEREREREGRREQRERGREGERDLQSKSRGLGALWEGGGFELTRACGQPLLHRAEQHHGETSGRLCAPRARA